MSKSKTILTSKQKRFCQEYVIDFNGTQAAIRAGYSKRTAKEQATRLLTKVHIQVYIRRLLNKQEEKLDITAERILSEIANIAFIDPKKLFDEKGKPIPLNEMDEKTAKLSFILKKLRPSDILHALELLGKHQALFKEVIEVTDRKIAINTILPDDLKDDK